MTLITGASSGIGAALAHVFARNGHEVVLAARRVPQLAGIAESIRAAGQRAHILPVDLTRADSTERIAHELAARNLEPAFLVNNAGYGLLGPARDARPRRTARDDRSQLPLAHRPLAALGQRARAPSRRHPQRGVDLGLHPRPRHVGLQRVEGLRDLVQRRAAARASPEGHPRDRALPRPGADRIPGARRHPRRALSARLRPHRRGRRASRAIAA